jgi:hypothetical protein
MVAYCTICGIKLVAKNKISYRPNSCRDCELERKRLYSKKKREEAKKKSTRPSTKSKTIKTNSKAKITKKVFSPQKRSADSKSISQSNFKKLSLKNKSENLKKEALKKIQEREKLAKAREKERLLKERDKEKLAKAREKERLLKEREREKLAKAREKERLLKERDKEKLRKEREKEKETSKKTKELEKEKKRKEKEEERLRKLQEREESKIKKLEELKAKEEEKKEKEAKEKEAKEKKRLLDLNIITDLPEEVLSHSSVKVKKRRLGDSSKTNNQIVNDKIKPLSFDLSSSALATAFDPTYDPGEVLRAPSNTPWEGANFKIVNGVFVGHTDDDQDETKGPSEDEVKSIIERIRLEHKTRKT